MTITLRRLAPALLALLPVQAVAQGVEGPSSSMLDGSVAKLHQHAQAILQAVPDMPRYLSDAALAFGKATSAAGTGRILITIVACLAAGIVAEWVLRRVTAGTSARLVAQEPASVIERLTRFGIDALLRAAAIGAFAVGMLVVWLAIEWPAQIRESGTALIAALLWCRMILAGLRLLLRPAEGSDRMLAAFELDVPTAALWYRHLGGFVCWYAFGWAIIATLRVFGVPRPGLEVLAYVLGLGLVAIAIALVWRRPLDGTNTGRLGAKAGRWLATFVVVVFWMMWTSGAMNGFWLLTVLVFTPMTIKAARHAARHLMRPVVGPDGTVGPVSVAAVIVEQAMRAAAILAGIAVLLVGWKLDVGSLAAQEDALTRLLRGGLHALIILLAADLGWNVIKALADNALANAQASAGVDANEARRRARVRTLLPIGRNIAAILMLVMAALMALSALGVEIGPLVASAGVVGVAVGFGCQTVVRDIISGMFYMLDDAFRVGEYIQSGSYKGVVESFSLRSVKLRHQRGPLFTIPFGMLGAVQNMSRDWVIVKDQIGITYDSDVDKAKKLIKQIGLELAKDPDLAPNILQPLKMQGIEQFGEYAINIRMKMMTKPGEQFVIRRRANALIKKAFDENGIKFAFPTVTLAGKGDDHEAVAAAAPQILKAAPAGH